MYHCDEIQGGSVPCYPQHREDSSAETYTNDKVIRRDFRRAALATTRPQSSNIGRTSIPYRYVPDVQPLSGGLGETPP